MTLRTRSILLLGLPLLALVVGLLLFGRATVLRSAESVERNDLQRTILSVRRTIEEEVRGLRGSVRDWGAWDDTYLYAAGTNPSYAETQLTANTFQTLRLDLVAILDNEGDAILSLSYRDDAVEAAELDDGLRRSIHEHPEALGGVVTAGGRPLLLATYPVRTSADTGPTRGTLAFGRWLSPDRAKEIGATVGADVLILSPAHPSIPAAVGSRLPAHGDAVVEEPLGADRIAGYGLLLSPLPPAPLVVRVELQREARSLAQRSLGASRVGVIAIAAFTIAAVLYLLERFVLLRITKLSREVREIGCAGSFTGRVTEGGRDEISALAHSTNVMLAALDSSHRELQGALTEVRTLGGLLPICASCKKIRDDGGYWHQVERYLSQHTQVRFSHGLCPDCVAKYETEVGK